MKRLVAILSFGFLLLAPLSVLAADGHGGKGSYEPMPGMEHGGHGGEKVAEGLIMLPEQTVDGVTAMVHLKDVKETMAKMGMKHTHHFMVMLKDAKSGKAIVPVMVAVKIVDPAAKESKPVELMSMEGHAGADVILAIPGNYTFKVAAKLPGDKKVQFEFVYVLK